MKRFITILSILLFIPLASAASGQLTVSIGDYDTTRDKGSQTSMSATVTVPSGVSLTSSNGTVEVTITPKSGLSCTTCSTTLSFVTSGSQSSKTAYFTLTGDETGTYYSPFTIRATSSVLNPGTATASSPIVVKERPSLKIEFNRTGDPVKVGPSEWEIPYEMNISTLDIGFTNVRVNITKFLGNASLSLKVGPQMYTFDSIPAHSTMTLNWIIKSTHFSGYGAEVEVTAENYLPQSHSSSGTFTSGGTGSGQTPSSSGGGGGGGGGQACINEGFQSLDSSMMICVIKKFSLQYKSFFNVVKALAASIVTAADMTLDYPAPTSTAVQDVLSKKVETLEGDIYQIAAEKTLDKWKFATSVVIARGDLEVDSMAAIAYAKANNMPILLTRPGELPQETIDAVTKLGAKNIVIVGGPVAVSRGVEDELAKIAKVDRIAGPNREDTAVEIAKDIKAPETIVIADGSNPSIEASLIANAYKAPIVYVRGDRVPVVTRDYLAKNKLNVNYRPMKVVFIGVSEKAREEIQEIMKNARLNS